MRPLSFYHSLSVLLFLVSAHHLSAAYCAGSLEYNNTLSPLSFPSLGLLSTISSSTCESRVVLDSIWAFGFRRAGVPPQQLNPKCPSPPAERSHTKQRSGAPDRTSEERGPSGGVAGTAGGGVQALSHFHPLHAPFSCSKKLLGGHWFRGPMLFFGASVVCIFIVWLLILRGIQRSSTDGQ